MVEFVGGLRGRRVQEAVEARVRMVVGMRIFDSMYVIVGFFGEGDAIGEEGGWRVGSCKLIE